MSDRAVVEVIGTKVDALTWEVALDRLEAWSERRESRVVCICNVHSVVTALDDRGHANALAEADMVTPDGGPLALMLRCLGVKGQERISGPDLMWRSCSRAAEVGCSVYLLGGSEQVLSKLSERLMESFPSLVIAGAISPPFREMTEAEDQAVVEDINQSGAGLVWVGLGCPKQERWMHAHRGRVGAVMIGVGAAFDYHAGFVARAPLWMQRCSLEWFYRLVQEPRRLWRRYATTNSIFVCLAARQLFHSAVSASRAPRSGRGM